ncbi:MAG TPA: DUF6544 family protein [Polyangiaceae bacterium]|nr:DUF6544 family protein [Polyangiaceae bacterium]
MRVLGALFLFLHGIAHLVGFRAAFWPASVPSRSSLLGGLVEIGYLSGRALGVAWLLVAVGYLAAAGLIVSKGPGWTTLVFWVTAASLVMCVLFWPEARIGLYIDLAVLLTVFVVSRSSSEHLAETFREEVERAALPTPAHKADLVTEQSIETLPEPVKRYLRFMGVIGRPRDWSFKAHFKARFRREPGEWLPCEALQYDTRLKLSRLFYMQLSLNGLPVTVRDTYLAGRGSMRAKALDLFPVVDGNGHEIDVGELVTYLNDAILMAPSLLLGPETTWQEVDANSFDVTLRDGLLSVKARVWLDQRGAPTDFSTTDRFFDQPDGKRVQTEWRTPVRGWQRAGGRQLPTRAEAVWQLPGGPFVYADFSFDPARVAFNVPPH